MKKIGLIFILFVLGLFLLSSRVLAAGPVPPPGPTVPVQGCDEPPNQCLKTCTTALPYSVSSCTNSRGISGTCCSANPTTSTGGTSAWGAWGDTPAGSSLSNFSNLLGVGAPTNASHATWENVLSTFLSLLFLAAIVISLAFFILGGYNWMFSGGDKQKVEKARQHIIFAIVGLVIIFVAVLIVSVLGSFFGINFLNLP